jgi:putative two-component system response regulator
MTANLLVVDDDPDSRDVVARYLAREGYSVKSAANGREALVAVATTIPDLIILDAMMPEMSGVEFLQVIRSYLRWSTVPVILLTAFAEGPHIDRAREFDVRQIFLKANYKLSDLAACVRRLLDDPNSDCIGAAG